MGRLPFELEVREPCRESWDGMTAASGGARHCARCDKAVHDLAGMTGREIERLVLRTGGELCARVTRRADGSMVMRPERMGSLAAGLVAVASLAPAAFAQKADDSPAVISGKIVPPNVDRQPGGWMVTFVRGGAAQKVIEVGEDGVWRAELPAGRYDLTVRSVFNHNSALVSAVDLHGGEQSFGEIHTREDLMTVVLGEPMMIDSFRSSPLGIFMHPVGTVRALAWRVRRWLHG